MAKRANNEGSIFRRRDGRWTASITVGGGKRKAYYGKTQGEVLRKLTAARKARQDGLPLVGERQTLGNYLSGWLADVEPSLRPRTWLRYEQLVRLHTLPDLGAVPLARLSPQQLQRLYASSLQKGLSPASVIHLHAVLRRALGQALRLGLVARNVALLAVPPRLARREMTTLSPEQARQLLQAAAGDRLEALYTLALSTGMRQGELLALRWRDVNLGSGALRVVGTLQQTPHGFRVCEPKTARSRRQVLLTQTAVSALRRHRARQAEERLLVGPAWGSDDFVFTTEAGEPESGPNVTHRFYTFLARSGLPHIRFHDLRHTAATLMLARGVHPKVASEMLGHSNISVTLDLYSHVTPTMQRAATEALDEIFRG